MMSDVAKLLRNMARPERLELPTRCFEGSRSIQLSYGRVVGNSTIWPGWAKVNQSDGCGEVAMDSIDCSERKRRLAGALLGAGALLLNRHTVTLGLDLPDSLYGCRGLPLRG